MIETETFTDWRGSFCELYNEDKLRQLGVETRYVQDNFAVSQRGVLRGLHFQLPPMAQGKLVTCLCGKIYDVAVDLRPNSPSYGKWQAVELTGGLLLYLPAGFAHGYAVLSQQACVFYKVTEYYSPQHEAGIIWSDERLAIDWPVDDPILSDKDQRWPTLTDFEKIWL